MRRSWICMGLAAFLLVACGGPEGPEAPLPPARSGPGPQAQAPRAIGDPTYLAELLTEARRLRLWEERLWHLLMHYRDDRFLGGVTSEADGPGFFNAPGGKTDPRAELEATLARFFTTELLEPGKQTAQCTFAARYHWLKTKLIFDDRRLPRQPCKRFDAWFAALEPASVSLVFASHYLNNPASMFGHTLLVLNRKGRPDNERMLNYAVNFGADVPPGDSALAFAMKGLFGGYQGRFSLLPYYLKLKEYGDIESRDMWEYELSLRPDQIMRMVRHAWEMGSTYFDYYFVDENCSYHLLSLLEVADPKFRLRDRFNLWTMPADTVRAVLEQAGVGVKVTYRPSRGQQLRQKLARLKGEEEALVRSLLVSPDNAESPEFGRLAGPRQALVMDAAADLYQFRIAGAQEPEDLEQKGRLRALLLRRSQLTAQPPRAPPGPEREPPERGHRSRRWGLAAGRANDDEAFQELSWQPAFHRLMSRDAGYAENSQINVLAVRLRHEEQGSRTLLEEFTVVDVVSLVPLTNLVKRPAWKLSAAWRRVRDGACGGCVPLRFNGGIGLALQSQIFTRETYFGLVELSLDLDDDLDKGFRAGLGASLGVMVDFTDAWRAALLGSSTEFGEGERGNVEKAEFRQRFSLTSDLELNLDFAWQNDYREGKVGLGYYF